MVKYHISYALIEPKQRKRAGPFKTKEIAFRARDKIIRKWLEQLVYIVVEDNMDHTVWLFVKKRGYKWKFIKSAGGWVYYKDVWRKVGKVIPW